MPRNPSCRLLPIAALLLAVLPIGFARAAPAQQAASPAAPGLSECDHFARLYRYAQESKAMCEEGRQVKAGPMTAKILVRCRAEQGSHFDQADVDDLMDTLEQQIQSQGIGNACNAASEQAWTLVSQ